MVLTDHTVQYVHPFTLYANWDHLRMAIAFTSVVGIAGVLTLAVFRWGEARRSAAIFLATIALMLFTNTYAVVHALGHPGTYILWFFMVCSVSCIVACMVAVSEVKRGEWIR